MYYERKDRLFWFINLKNKLLKFADSPCNLNLNNKIYDIQNLVNPDEAGASSTITLFFKLKTSGFITDKFTKEELDIIPKDFTMKISFEPKETIKPKFTKDEVMKRKKYVADLYRAMKYNDNEIVRDFFYKNISNRKIYYFSNNVKNNSLLFEIFVYETIINELFLKNYTPNVILYLTNIECKNFYDSLNDTDENSDSFKIKKEIEKLESNPYVYNQRYESNNPFNYKGIANILILERSFGKNLSKWIDQNPINIDKNFTEFKKILIQAIFTLAIFYQVGLVHNDLHVGNTFVDQEKNNIHFLYFYENNKWFDIITKNFFRIYDYDHGNFTGKGPFKNIFKRNTGLDDIFGPCVFSNQCNNEVYSFKDILHFLCKVLECFESEKYKNEKNFKIFQNFFLKYFPLYSDIKGGFKKKCSLCELKPAIIVNEEDGENEFGRQKCQVNEKYINFSFEDILNDPFFDEFRKTNIKDFDKKLLKENATETLENENIYFFTNLNQTKILNNIFKNKS
jgi:hypothetical protein